MTDGDLDLSELRAESDSIDQAVQDLLIRRTEAVEQVSRAKRGAGVKLRPGREAQIMRALVGRHRGAFPKPELVRVWREILSTQLRLQGPFSVGVYGPEGESGFWRLARDQYGSYTPMNLLQSPWRVIEEVAKGTASVGILPVPRLDDEEPWWPHLTNQGQGQDGQGSLRIIAKLPFAPSSRANMPGGNGGALEALVIAALEPEPSGEDHSYLVVDMNRELTSGAMVEALSSAGLTGAPVARWHDRHPPERWLHLLHCESYLAPGDGMLGQLAEGLNLKPAQIIPIGDYAVPLAPAELSSREPAKLGSNAEKIA